ncbi:MAG: site-specific integrase [Tepidisphaeraceae bacterium]
MAKSPVNLPSYRHHKASGQAFVVLSGRQIYLGPHGTRLSRDNYDRTVSEWLERGRNLPQYDGRERTSVAVLVNAFRKSDAYPKSQIDGYTAVMKLLVRLYGLTPADEFGAVALKVVRSEMVAAGWKRRTVNERIHNLRRVFQWGIEHQMVSPDGLAAMREVAPLKAGRTAAPESKPVQPVATDHVEACLAKMPPTVAAMVKIQMHTGMRAGELVIMRTADIDTSDSTSWVYRPSSHKTAHLGKVREIPLGKVSMEAIAPLLLTDLTAYIFSPAKAEAERLAIRAENRKTPPGQGNAAGTNRVAKRKRKPAGDRYTTAGYRQAIDHAIDRAFPPPPHLARQKGETPAAWRKRLGQRWADLLEFRRSVHWSPHQLRHRFATLVANTFTMEHAQKSLGHSNMKVTQIYAKLALAKAKEVARAIG